MLGIDRQQGRAVAPAAASITSAPAETSDFLVGQRHHAAAASAAITGRSPARRRSPPSSIPPRAPPPRPPPPAPPPRLCRCRRAHRPARAQAAHRRSPPASPACAVAAAASPATSVCAVSASTAKRSRLALDQVERRSADRSGRAEDGHGWSWAGHSAPSAASRPTKLATGTTPSSRSSTPPCPGTSAAVLHPRLALEPAFKQVADLRQHRHRRPEQEQRDAATRTRRRSPARRSAPPPLRRPGRPTSCWGSAPAPASARRSRALRNRRRCHVAHTTASVHSVSSKAMRLTAQRTAARGSAARHRAAPAPSRGATRKRGDRRSPAPPAAPSARLPDTLAERRRDEQRATERHQRKRPVHSTARHAYSPAHSASISSAADAQRSSQKAIPPRPQRRQRDRDHRHPGDRARGKVGAPLGRGRAADVATLGRCHNPP